MAKREKMIRKIIAILYLLLRLSGIVSSQSSCSDTTVDYSYKVQDPHFSWDDARLKCEGLGGCLARPLDAKILEKIKQAIPLSSVQSEYWSGVKFDKGLNTFVWSDGTGTPTTIGFSQMVNRAQQNGHGFKKRCLLVVRNKNELQADECNASRKFICQFKVNMTTTPVSATPIGALSHPTSTSIMTTKTIVISTTISATPTTSSTSLTMSKATPTSDPRTTPSKPTVEPTNSEKVKSYNNAIKSQNPEDPKSLDDTMTLTNGLMLSLKTSEEEDKENQDLNIMTASQEFETFLVEYAREQFDGNSSTNRIVRSTTELNVTMEKVSDANETLQFPQTDRSGQSFVSLTPGIFQNQERIVVSSVMHGVNKLLPSGAQAIVNGVEIDDTELYSSVVSCTLDPKPSGVLSDNITITLYHAKPSSPSDRPICVFWEVNVRTAYNGSWSRDGCTVVRSNSSVTTCTCDHMTSFALLMQVGHGKQVGKEHKLALEVITFVGCGLSLVGEILTIIAYVVLMNVKHEQSQIRINLVASLAVAQVFFLSGISATDTKGACIFVAVMIHYMYLVAFGWMMLEGVYLYLMVVKVFNTEVKMKLYYAFSWGFPLLVVVVSLIIASTMKDGIYSYTNDQFCWVSFSNGLVWTFVCPVLLISLVNMIILVRVVRELTRLQSAKMSDTQNAKQGLKACVVLFPLLGLTWVFGILAVTEAGLVFQYIFTVLNSLQGFLIFVLHVLRSTEMRHAFQRKRKQWETSRGTDLVTTTKSHIDSSVSYNRQPLADLESTDSAHGRRNQVSPSPGPVRADSARTCITPVESARDNTWA